METPTKSDLNNLRLLIDDIDNALLQLFKDRMEVSKAVGEFKKANQLPIFQENRWNELLKDRLLKGEKIQLSETFIKSIFEAIHEESLRLQNHLQKNE